MVLLYSHSNLFNSIVNELGKCLILASFLVKGKFAVDMYHFVTYSMLSFVLGNREREERTLALSSYCQKVFFYCT